ncbi:MAG: hypothetical protein GEU83_02650 [Pseudonocardiaceae bacterium]|nr:hypothetical protein [Pseudonocardiaceae bacterium]
MTHTGTSHDRNGRAALVGQALPDQERAGESCWVAVRCAAAVFARQVLLRPLRIGTLTLLAAAVVAVVAGAEEWWIILGVVLFQTAGSLLIVLWTDGEQDQLPERSPRRTPAPPGQRTPDEE